MSSAARSRRWRLVVVAAVVLMAFFYYRPLRAYFDTRHALQQMALEWGVVPLEIPECANVEDLWSRSLEAVRANGLVAPGDRVVITAGTLVNVPGTTNVIKVEVA